MFLRRKLGSATARRTRLRPWPRSIAGCVGSSDFSSHTAAPEAGGRPPLEPLVGLIETASPFCALQNTLDRKRGSGHIGYCALHKSFLFRLEPSDVRRTQLFRLRCDQDVCRFPDEALRRRGG